INWEIMNLNKADLIILYLYPNTISPITLMELGYYSQSRKLIIYYLEGYYYYRNI
ncbi:hypothetical protein P154DRAFT_424369, partial [Amniculicola lignicola CBS 123094]